MISSLLGSPSLCAAGSSTSDKRVAKERDNDRVEKPQKRSKTDFLSTKALLEDKGNGLVLLLGLAHVLRLLKSFVASKGLTK
jgi:hypothetical protein